MDIMVLDSGFQMVHPISKYYSLIWTIRYSEVGDFELYLPLTEGMFRHLRVGNYLSLKDSDRLMLIEDIEVNSNPEDGQFLTVTGRSLESILTRRIIWEETVLSGSLQDAVLQLLTDSIIAPKDRSRIIDDFIFIPSEDPYILEQTIEAEYWGEEIYEVIEDLCASRHIGFKLTLNEGNQFEFQLYRGVDRSYNQEVNPYVVFSPDFENLIDSSYLKSTKLTKNVTLIKGEESGWAHRMESLGNSRGLSRREIFTDASGVHSETEEGYIPDDIYTERLHQKGRDSLDEHKLVSIFESNVDVYRSFIYGRDFDLGDLVQLKNESGIEEVTRMTELIFAQDIEGSKVYPTFEVDG